MSKVTKELLIKTLCFSVGVFLLIVLLKETGLVELEKEIYSRVGNPSEHPVNAGEWAILFSYRLLVYFGLPIVVTIVEFIFFKQRRKTCWAILNLEAHFIALSIVCGIYYLFAIDYLLGMKILTIEHSLTSLMLLLFTVLLGKKFPHIFIQDEEKSFGKIEK